MRLRIDGMLIHMPTPMHRYYLRLVSNPVSPRVHSSIDPCPLRHRLIAPHTCMRACDSAPVGCGLRDTDCIALACAFYVFTILLHRIAIELLFWVMSNSHGRDVQKAVPAKENSIGDVYTKTSTNRFHDSMPRCKNTGQQAYKHTDPILV